MKAIMYDKVKGKPKSPILFELNEASKEIISETFCRNGRVVLLPEVCREKIRTHLADLAFRDLKDKPRKVELTRAMKLGRRDKQPRYLTAGFATAGSFKRSFEPFLKENYQPQDPACILFLPDLIHQELIMSAMKEHGKAEDKDSGHQAFLHQWVTEISSQKEITDLEESYLGTSFSSCLIRALVFRAAKDDTPVIITGESGTGKNKIARLIHENSDRKKKEFVVVNCSAIPDSLFESEVFGHVGGAFTDARKETVGLFEQANGGTLFLDEIGDLALLNQAKLLHAVDTGEFRKVGSTAVHKSNVRLVAATGYDLPFRINEKKFRIDLFYRLNSFRILVKPLREHPEDIPLLANAFWSTKNNLLPLSQEILEYLKKQPWYGNVRELHMTLSNLHTMFGDRHPSLAALECLRWISSEHSIQAQVERAGFDNYLQNESKYRLDRAIQIIREIRIKLRPLINHDMEVIRNQRKVKEIKLFVTNQTDMLDELCKDPLFLKGRELYDQIRIFRFELDKRLKDPKFSAGQFNKIWQSLFQKQYDEILAKIFKFVW